MFFLWIINHTFKFVVDIRYLVLNELQTLLLVVHEMIIDCFKLQLHLYLKNTYLAELKNPTIIKSRVSFFCFEP